MAIEYNYDPVLNMVYSFASPKLKLSHLADYFERVLKDDRIRPGFIEVNDFGKVIDMNIVYSETSYFSSVWKRYRHRGCKAVLIYAPSDVSYGVCRMVQSVISMQGSESKDTAAFFVIRDRTDLDLKLAELTG